VNHLVEPVDILSGADARRATRASGVRCVIARGVGTFVQNHQIKYAAPLRLFTTIKEKIGLLERLPEQESHFALNTAETTTMAVHRVHNSESEIP
jgi:hypothetical protein